VTKSKRLRWEGHVPGICESRGYYRVFGGKTRGKRTLGKLILKAKFMNWDVGAWNGLI
jgi:hypothetical protein